MEYTISEEKLQNVFNKVFDNVLSKYQVITYHSNHPSNSELSGNYIEGIDVNQDYKVMFSYLDTHLVVLLDYQIITKLIQIFPMESDMFHKFFVNYFREKYNVNVEEARFTNYLGNLDFRNVNHTKI
jgi:hypothetical protein